MIRGPRLGKREIDPRARNGFASQSLDNGREIRVGDHIHVLRCLIQRSLNLRPLTRNTVLSHLHAFRSSKKCWSIRAQQSGLHRVRVPSIAQCIPQSFRSRCAGGAIRAVPMPALPPAAAATFRAHPCKILRLRARNHMRTSSDACRRSDTDRVVTHFVDRELRIGQRPTEFEHQRVPMRADDSLPSIAHQPESSVPVIGDAAGPKMAIPPARSAHDEPLESFPFRIAERRKR